jgi:BirA family biotin operon repressor/biotin-[acetyl-CoA-carboxylase] ligase
MNINLISFDSIDSTNTEALKQARLGAEEGLCIVAREQTAGRGRHGRVWVSESDAGLFFSIVFRPKIEPPFLPLITLACGVAVHDTLKEFGLSPDIKWVNDILVNEKKISGILAEATETEKGLAVVVGIGINIRSSNFPPEISDTATSIEEASQRSKADTRSVPSPEQLSQVLSNYLVHFYDVLSSENGASVIIEEWRNRSTYFSCKKVRVTMENATLEGVTDGLQENGALRVRQTDGKIVIVQTGDVQRLRAAATYENSLPIVAAEQSVA